MKDTNITCPVDATTHAYTYSCNNVAGNKEYIVRYIKDLGDGKVYEMKTNVSVGAEDVTGETISKVTTLITDTISKAIEEAVVSLSTSSETVVKELMAKVKNAVKTSVQTLIAAGTISIPDDSSMVVQLDTNQSFSAYAGATSKSNDKIADSSAAILNTNTVTNSVNAQKNQAKVSEYASMTHEQLIKEIFRQTGDGGDIEGWIAKFLADKYTTQTTISDFNTKLKFQAEALTRDDNGDITGLDQNNWVVQDLQRMGIDLQTYSSAITSLLVSVEEAVNTKIANGTMLTSFNEALTEYKTLAAKTNPTDDELEILSEFPPVIGYLFGSDSGFDGTKFNNIGQELVYILYAEGKFVPEEQKTLVDEFFIGHSLTVFDEQVKNLRLLNFNPEFIFTDLGLANVINNYDIPEVSYFDIRTNNYWDSIGQKEFASFNFDLSRAPWMINGVTYDAAKLTSVTLKYPTATGTTTKTIDKTKLKVHSWKEGFSLEYSPWTDCSNNNQPCMPDTTIMDITNNVPGDYTVTAIYDGKTFAGTFNRFVLKNASQYAPKLTSPLARPNWPIELQDQTINWNNLTQTQQAAQNKFNTEQQAYMQATDNNGFVSFATNDGDNLRDFTIKWDDAKLKADLATLNLPSNIIPAYQVGISLYEPDLNGDNSVSEEERNTCNRDWSQCNTEIFNTWWNNKPIKSNSYTIPAVLPQNSGEGRYQVHVDLIFIDKNRGDQVAQGGNSFSEFKVGTVGQLTGDEKITFNGNLSLENSSTMPEHIKVGFMQEQCTYNPTTYVSDCNSTMLSTTTPNGDGVYSLDVNASYLKSHMNNGSNFNIIAWDDNDTNGDWARWSPTQNGETSWWLDNKWFWFENWGEFKISTNTWDKTTGENNNTSYSIKPRTNVTIEDMNFRIWNWGK
jgi:hypothetical protein